MTISYSLGFKEYCRYHLLFTRHVSAAILWFMYISLALFAGALFIGAAVILCIHFYGHVPFSEIFKGGVHDLGLPLEIGVPLGIFLPLGWKLNGQGVLEMDQEGITESRRRYKIMAPWPSVNLLEEDQEYLYIGSKFLIKSRMLYAMLPKRAFSSRDKAQAFFDQAVAYREQAIGRPQANQPTAWPPAPKV